MFKKISIVLSVICLLFVFGFGCKGLSEEEQAFIDPVILDYWTVFDDVEMLRAFASEYKEMRPYVDIRVRKVRFEEFDDLFVNALADDVGPDVISVHVKDIGKYRDRLSAMPSSVVVSDVQIKGKYAKELIVTKHEQPMPSMSTIRGNFVSTVIDDVVTKGQVFGLPLALDTLAIYYNKDLLDRAGIPLAPESWDEFFEAVESTTVFNSRGDIIQSGAALGTGENIPHSFDILSLLMMQNGVTMSRGNSVTFASGFKKPNVDHPTLKALRFYTDFAKPTKKAYMWNEDMPDAFDAFVRGQTAFYFGYAYEADQLVRRAPQINMDVIPVPQLDELNPVNVANYWIESVVKKSKNQAEAWDFIRFMATPDNIKRYAEATGQPSPLRLHIAEQQESIALAPFVEQILSVKNWYHGSNSSVARDAFDILIKQYKEPYAEKEKPLERDANLIINAARVVQQTY